MRSVTLLSWLVTVGLGAFMLRTWLVRGGLSRERARKGGLPPQLIFGHAAAAVVGLAGWVAFLVSGARPLAWGAVGLLAAAVGLGLCTVTLWTPYPAPKPGERRPVSREGIPVRDVPDAAAVPGPPPGATGPDDAQTAFKVTDEMIARFLADPRPVPGPRTIRPNPAVLVPVAHGFAAIVTFMLAVLSAIT
jgi:hypothetical protein